MYTAIFNQETMQTLEAPAALTDAEAEIAREERSAGRHFRYAMLQVYAVSIWAAMTVGLALEGLDQWPWAAGTAYMTYSSLTAARNERRKAVNENRHAKGLREKIGSRAVYFADTLYDR